MQTNQILSLKKKEVNDTDLSDLMYVAGLAKDYAKRARSQNTVKSYTSDWKDFDLWCKLKKLTCMPADPHTVACYLADRASHPFTDSQGKQQPALKVSTLARRLSAISQAHQISGMEFNRRHTVIQETWKGIKNTHGTSQKGKDPILIEDLRLMIKFLGDGTNEKIKLINIRDKALLLIGFAGAFRRSELASIQIEDLMLLRDGYVIRLNRSKTDQEGEGREVAIPYGANPETCPVRALQDWIKLSKISCGPLFRSVNRHGQMGMLAISSHSIARVIKRNPHLRLIATKYSGHSLRSGFVTTAAMVGLQEYAIMKQTGHKRSDTLKKYIRSRDIWKDNPASKVGL